MVNGEDGVGGVGRGIAKDRLACLDGSVTDKREADVVEGRTLLRGVGVVGVIANKEVLRGAIVVDATGGAKDDFAIAQEIVNHAQAGREVRKGAGIELLRSAIGTNGVERDQGGIKEAEGIALRTDDAKVVPAQTEVDAKLGGCLPGVHQINAGTVLVGVARAGAVG